MKIINPQQITPSSGYLTSSNVPTGEYPDWVAGSYDQGDRVVVGIEIYEALTAATDDPLIGVTKEVPTWLRLGYINKWRMFYNAKDSKTTYPDIVDVTINTGRLGTNLALLGMEGFSLTVTMTDPVEGEVYRNEQVLQDIGVADWWEYYFLDYDAIEDVVLDDLPPYNTADVRVQVSQVSGGDASIGLMLYGTETELGTTLYGTGVGNQNFSVRERDGFGNLTITPRRSISIVNYDVSVETPRSAFVAKTLQRVANTPTLFVGNPDFEDTIIYGVVEDFRNNISTPTLTDMTVEVRSL